MSDSYSLCCICFCLYLCVCASVSKSASAAFSWRNTPHHHVRLNPRSCCLWRITLFAEAMTAAWAVPIRACQHHRCEGHGYWYQCGASTWNICVYHLCHRPFKVIIILVIPLQRPAGIRGNRRSLTPLGFGRAQPTASAPWSFPPVEPKMVENTHWCWRTLWGRPSAPATWWYLVGFDGEWNDGVIEKRCIKPCLTYSVSLCMWCVFQIKMTWVFWRVWPTRQTKRSLFCKKSAWTVAMTNALWLATDLMLHVLSPLTMI